MCTPSVLGRHIFGFVHLSENTNTANHNVDVFGIEHDSVYVRRVMRKSYELTDHLGNVRVVISDVKETEEVDGDNKPEGPYETVILAANNYYPFGMLQPGRHWETGEYRYGYNGMEKDDEVKGEGNSYDFGARIYDPRIGRWMSRDPLEAKYPSLSAYNAFANNPILFIDPDGKVIQLYEKRNGKVTQVKMFNHQLASDGLNAFLQTKEGYAYVAQFASKGQTIAGVTFTEDGIYSNHVLQLQVSDQMVGAVGGHVSGVVTGERVSWNEDNATVIEQSGTLVVAINISTSLKNYAGNTEATSGDRTTDILDYAAIWGHEALGHGYNDGAIAKAINDGDFAKAATLMGASHGDEDHKGMINNSPNHKTFLIDFFVSLQKYTKEKWNMSPSWTKQAKQRHINHMQSVVGEDAKKQDAKKQDAKKQDAKKKDAKK